MKRFVIERSLPGVHNMAPGELREASATSNAALAKLAGKVTWEHSYVVNDKTFCIYIADSEQSVLEHAKLSGFPATKISEVRAVIEPMTGV
jgi:hypothetical protein